MNGQSCHVARARAEPILLADPDPAWAEAFAAEEVRLRERLAEIPIGRIEHVGSTAVPGLVAKPIVDMLIEVPDLQTVHDRIAPVLKAAGYEYFWRPTGPGEAGVAYAWFIRRDASGARTHHLHMLPPGSTYWDRLRFRDLLRARPDHAAEYAAVKRETAARHRDDRAAYARAKGRFIGRVMSGHEDAPRG
ncbi:MAG TPA: GrpB family protein [Amaricoccus sp.]|uniref:GrpB family protein n=1 Tax=Amaricoccus sp. TaxID=1872485 RepID=UPI002D06FD95|nr:GrpB family protein [Amaricoccus sp.]HMQ94062.1 GrpB family protein [Amaricoccus sp.]HMR53075.1 GrpB family protein [Amaricoccus sp.]HMR61073.1 GrpB family protein [Amaricoccus sp.]HMT99972.1 GrpB family protein [Amaricoccus sp.]